MFMRAIRLHAIMRTVRYVQIKIKKKNMNNTLKVTLIIFVVISICSFLGCAQQDISKYAGIWKGDIPKKNELNLEIKIEKSNPNFVFSISNSKLILSKIFSLENNINLQLENNINFNGIINELKNEITGFINFNGYLYPIVLKKAGSHYIGYWNLSGFQYLQPESLYLKFKEVDNSQEQYSAYPILGTLWCSNFKKVNNDILFTDYFTGINFEGKLKTSEIILDVYLGKKIITEITYRRAEETVVQTTQQNQKEYEGWDLAENLMSLIKMEENIRNKTLSGTESVLVATNGKIVYENYYDGFTVNTPHDTRSASKSIASALIGIALDEMIIESVDEKLYDYIPEKYQYTKDSLKSNITIKNLLTMSSGLDVGDKAEEGYYQDESEDSWLKTVLEAPMIHKPGTYTDYGSANPFLLGVYLNNRLEQPLEFYMQEKFFEPLGITNYILNTDDTGIQPYYGGGLHITPRDFLKFGQLYLNKGTWNGKRIISEKWINESLESHTRLEDVSDKNEYGYLWWHNNYMVKGRNIKSIEARGAGGQYVFIIQELNTVIVITSGNYRNGKTRQPESIIEEYILPAILNH